MSSKESEVERKVLGEVLGEEKELVSNLVQRLDTRAVPKLERYSEESGISLTCYLKRFEEYYRDSYKGGEYLMVGELEQQLTGRALEGLRSVKQVGDTYERTKKRLLGWYEEEKGARKQRSRRSFQNMQLKPGESIFSYSNRLQAQFRIAYPNKNSENSSSLIDKFRQTVPKSFRSIVNNQILSLKLKNKKMGYSRLQKCARIYDLDHDHTEEEKVEREREVVINLGTNLATERSQQHRSFNKTNPSPPAVRANWGNPPRGYNNQPYRFRNNLPYQPRQPLSESFIPNNSALDLSRTCMFCKRFGHAAEHCRTRLGLCYNCGKKGHIVRDCWMVKGARYRSESPNPMRGVQRELQGRSRTVDGRQMRKENLNSLPPS